MGEEIINLRQDNPILAAFNSGLIVSRDRFEYSKQNLIGWFKLKGIKYSYYSVTIKIMFTDTGKIEYRELNFIGIFSGEISLIIPVATWEWSNMGAERFSPTHVMNGNSFVLLSEVLESFNEKKDIFLIRFASKLEGDSWKEGNLDYKESLESYAGKSWATWFYLDFLKTEEFYRESKIELSFNFHEMN